MGNGSNDGIQTKVSMLSAKEYKTEMGDIGRGLAVLKSDMKATQSAFAGQEDSVVSLTEKQKNLQSQYDLHGQKVALINAQLDASTEKYGENSKQTDSLKIALNNAKAAMNQVGSELDGTTKALDAEGEQATESAKETGKWKDALSDAGKVIGAGFVASAKACAAAIAAVGAAAGAAVSAGYDFAKSAGEMADNVLTLSAQTGVSAEELQKWGYAANFLDVPVETMTGSLAKLTKQMGNAGDATGSLGVDSLKLSQAQVAEKEATNAVAEAQAAYDKAVKNRGANSKTAQDAALKLEKAQNSLTQATRNVETAMKPLPGKSNAASEAFEKLGVKYRDKVTGELRNNQDVFADCIDALGKMENETERDALAMELFGKKAQDLNPLILAGGDALRDAGDEAARMGVVFSGDALEAMGSFDDSIQRMNASSEGLKNSIGLMLIPAFQPLVDTASTTMAQVAMALQDGLQPGELETIITNLTSNISTAMGEVSTLVTDAIPVVSGALTSVVGILAENLPGLIEQLLPAAMQLLQSIIDAVVANIEPLTNMAVNLITSIATFLIENADKLLDGAVAIVTGLVSGITEKLPELIPLAVEMIVKLATSLVEAIPQLVEKLPEIVKAIWDGLAAVDWIGLGLNLIQGLVNGLNSAVGSLLETIKNVFVGIWNAILGVFGIASPSTEAESAAGFILSGLLQGFESAVTAVCDAVKRIFGQIWDAIKSIFGFGSESEESKEAKSAGKDIMTGMQSGITDNQDELKNAVTNVSKAVLDKFRSELGIQDGTSTKTKPYGQALAYGISRACRLLYGDQERQACGYQRSPQRRERNRHA